MSQSTLDSIKGIDRYRRIRRISYIGITLIIWFYLPLWASSMLYLMGFDTIDVLDILKVYEGGGTATGKSFIFNPFVFWYVQIPVHIHYTIKRVRDVGWSPYFAGILWLPILNFIIWFWPGTGGDNEQGSTPYVSSISMKLFVFTSPITMFLMFMVCSLIVMRSS